MNSDCKVNSKDWHRAYLKTNCEHLFQDMNQLSANGVTRLTWSIGNAENSSVYYNLTRIYDYELQSKSDIVEWINRVDDMKFFIPGSICTAGTIREVQQTCLQLCIAKGYRKGHNNGNRTIDVSNLQLAELLLKMGADVAINYQEPSNGFTALHFACIRRDYLAIKLLIDHEANININSYKGKTPRDMLSINYKQAYEFLEFHTSPDKHPRTFWLDEKVYNDYDTLNNCHKCMSNI